MKKQPLFRNIVPDANFLAVARLYLDHPASGRARPKKRDFGRVINMRDDEHFNQFTKELTGFLKENGLWNLIELGIK